MQMQPLVMGNTSLVFTDRHDGTETDAPESGFNLGNASELLPEKLTGIKRISRRAMSAPSSGSSKVHAVEQQEILDEAFA